jgi:hypothetical protein
MENKFLDILSAIRDAYPNLSDLDAINITTSIWRCEIETERNEIIRGAFCVHGSHVVPALEAIAVQLGFSPGSKVMGNNIVDAIYSNRKTE